MCVSISGGLCPDLDLVVSSLHSHAGQNQLDVAVAVAGVGNIKYKCALLQFAGGSDAFADLCGPALGIHFLISEVKCVQNGSFAGLLGDGQGCVGFHGLAALVGDGVNQLVAAGGFGGSLAVLEVQCGGSFHGDQGGDVAIFGVSCADTCQSVEFAAGFHSLISDTGDDGSGVLAAAAAGSQGQNHCQAQNQSQNLTDILHKCFSFH